jgi:hypothetical protein
LNSVYNWSVQNQDESEYYRTLPSDLTGAGYFVAHICFHVDGGYFANRICRLIVQYYGGFDASKSHFALRGMPEYGKLPDNAQRCSYCQKKKEESNVTVLRGCASCGVVHYCGQECQKADWKRHKESCKIWSEENKNRGERVGENRKRREKKDKA